MNKQLSNRQIQLIVWGTVFLVLVLLSLALYFNACHTVQYAMGGGGHVPFAVRNQTHLGVTHLTACIH